ncbi:MAG: hypothetical protein ACI8UO_004819 [Verrucomicrobiales bacterium]|jgi:hypothetical protein
METMNALAEERMPTQREAIAFRFKTLCFRVKRTLTEISSRPGRLQQLLIDAKLPVAAESRSLLYPSQLGAEFALQSGKIQNLRVAARFLNGLKIPAGETFSFWSHVPRPTRMRGFVDGRELREGCVIPSVGGGLCQLSNALYDAALKAGMEIVERHGHSRILPGSMAEAGRDATVFWNYVDLRFRPATDVQLEVLLGRGELIVRFRGEAQKPTEAPNQIPAGDAVESCETCGVTSCFRHPTTLDLAQNSATAWIVDAWWPEHDAYLREHRAERDWLFTPLAGRNYRWTTTGFAKVRQAQFCVIRRSIVSRRLASQGAARQKALLRMDEQLARSFARRIPSSATHLVVSQNLLPYLWRDGVLVGRTFDVLMTRLPMTSLQETLDRAAARWPKSPTLADFRADPDLVQNESAALAEARNWITPHSKIAELAGEKALKLDWAIPNAERAAPGQQLLFPASTLGRKGAWELRELGLPLKLAGPTLESPDFWEGIEVERVPFGLDGVCAAVVLPAWVENQPRRLLQAAAAGIPVIASEACGLDGVEGVTTIPEGDVEALRKAIAATS